jgi:zinc/manganese transport system substrate-binding protein
MTMTNLIARSLPAALLWLAALLHAPLGQAELRVFACEPEWGALAKEIGGERIDLYVATTALQDPHRIEARPSLIARARRAQLLVCTGAELEIGWLPLLQSQSANPAIQNGQPGYFMAASYVELIQRPQQIDRSQGDVHAAGNPHIHLDPRNIERVAAALGERMALVDAPNAEFYRARTRQFLARWQHASIQWQAESARLKGATVVVQHQDISYLLQWLGMQVAGSLEPKPGIPPTASHLSALLAVLKQQPAKAIVLSAYTDPRPAQWLSEHSKLPITVVAFTVGGNEKAQDLFSLYDDTLTRLLAAIP